MMKWKEGGLVEATESEQEALFQQANAADITAITVDCDRARNRSAVLRAIAKAVDYPEYFGKDLDALYECLCDTVQEQTQGVLLWLDKLHSGDPLLAEDAAAIIDICQDVTAFALNEKRYFGFVVIHAGKHPEPEAPASSSFNPSKLTGRE